MTIKLRSGVEARCPRCKKLFKTSLAHKYLCSSCFNLARNQRLAQEMVAEALGETPVRTLKERKKK